MTIYSVYVINKAGGLIYQYDHHKSLYENEKTFRYKRTLFCFLLSEIFIILELS